ncbi:MAG: ribosomal-processing cysteine protease Prp [Clostridiales bacterium]|jgi:uncharacterized protein YsxB (DUF464 family)|nr:ribosomal-processing cysteine protease Prp [Clostridiales bacterium]
MITVIVDRDKVTRNIAAIYMSGHSGFAEEGYDTVCAGASTLCYTAAYALTDICGYDDEKVFRVTDEGLESVNVRISVPEESDEDIRNRAQVIMRTVELGLMNLAATVNEEGNTYIEIIHSKED